MLRTSASFRNDRSENTSVSLSEVISALTFALDLTEDAVPGHSLRCCLLGMRIAAALGVPEDQQASLYYALLLKDVGCSSNAARMTQIVGGDDRVVKAQAKLADWTRPHHPDLRSIRVLWQAVLPGHTLAARVGRMARIAITQHRNNREVIGLRCERGAQTVRLLEMGELAAQTVRHLDEHWDGRGYPNSFRGDQIPLLSRICLVAQNLDVFALEDGIEVSMEILRKRSGTWFDPEIVRVASDLHAAGHLWNDCRAGDDVGRTRRSVLQLDPGTSAPLASERVDHICEAFATVVDAKSPFTYRHSLGVADVAVRMANAMGLDPLRIQLVHRTALLHDLGKLAVPNSILDKHGSLTMQEWFIIARHPALSRSILERVSSFHEMAAIAGEHHERLDGSGYPCRLTADEMSIESRLIAIADIFTAMAEERPYRTGVDPQEVLAGMKKLSPHKLDASCMEALCLVFDKCGNALPAAVRP